ncbi:hypothetical protein PR003_g24387 [Phytophthora rubi]|uniref:Uncharacterized protein n=1 Tax=Phytophthora rubi TaxID=129364 RepID=A0A6A4CRN9_9STRA|nr:hypothetical protein PR003_g24387 [Phytophthora rubi]
MSSASVAEVKKATLTVLAVGGFLLLLLASSGGCSVKHFKFSFHVWHTRSCAQTHAAKRSPYLRRLYMYRSSAVASTASDWYCASARHCSTDARSDMINHSEFRAISTTIHPCARYLYSAVLGSSSSVLEALLFSAGGPPLRCWRST